MLFSKDMKELIELFERFHVEYALVGGFAVNYYGYVRTTQDIDLLINPSQKNAERIVGALAVFGFGNAEIPQDYFERAGSAIHLGVEPNRIDILTHLVSVSNEQIFSHIKKVSVEGILIPIISRDDLIEVKRKSERFKDKADAEELEKRGFSG